MDPILGFEREYRFLSNFYPAPITGTDGSLWPTVEHAYQAFKTTDRGDQQLIRAASSPGRAKRIGRTVALRPDWDAMKFDVMARLLEAKFRQHPGLTVRLMATGDADLVEVNDWGDRLWGVCRGQGQNHLGRLLMALRTQLLAERRARTL